MVRRRSVVRAIAAVLFHTAAASAQDVGAIRGVVTDRDFDAPLPLVKVEIVETGQTVTASEQGNYSFTEVAPGTYTLAFSKEGFTTDVRPNVVVVAGRMTEVNASLTGEFAEMDEVIVQDLQLDAGSEAALLNLRFEAPALIDSVGEEFMSRAGAGDAASALKLVSGATVQDGKFAVIRGLPDRYVNSQMNSVRLPTADADKRAVELDQFPSTVLHSIQVSKTFTPDQQGDASGGAVNVLLKDIPAEGIFQVKTQYSYNTQTSGRSDFLSYQGGGVSYWGRDDGGRDIQFDNIGDNWDGAVGVMRTDAPTDYKWSMAIGGKHDLESGVTIGAFVNLFHENDSSFYDNGMQDSYWVDSPGQPMTPQYIQGTPQQGEFQTRLFDVTQGSQQVKWGALGTVGLETENHSLGLVYLYTRSAIDKATLAEDTRGKPAFFPGYNPNNPNSNGFNQPDAAPYQRFETLDYTERTTQTLQLSGQHTIPVFESIPDATFNFLPTELDWTLSTSEAALYQPDKRLFGSIWKPGQVIPIPPFPPIVIPPTHSPAQPAANALLGGLNRIWKDISEESNQISANWKLPFEQWSGDEGYIKVGVFNDTVSREFSQDSFSNVNDTTTYNGPFDDFWSAVFPDEPTHPIFASDFDVDYTGSQDISALYYMMDLPLNSKLNIIGGLRYEQTELSIRNFPDDPFTAIWIPPGGSSQVLLNPPTAADVDYKQTDWLPAIGFVLAPLDAVTIRGSYSETVARQTFKELSPIIQQEYLGGPIFVGNPQLRMSAVKNYDLRFDYTPFEGALASVSWFRKDVTDPIEFIQRNVGFTFTSPVNYPEGMLSGYEFELRQDLGHYSERLAGLSVGANATFIDSEVMLPADQAAIFAGLSVPINSRPMTAAPEHLYNFYATYDVPETGTQLSLFYTVKGDTLVTGAGQSGGNFVPSIYSTEYGTLNFSLSQKLGEYLTLQFQAKNLTDPLIQSVYRSQFIGADLLYSSYSNGIDLSISLSAKFTF